MNIECFQCIIDKCYHSPLIPKIFDMVFAGGGRTIRLYTTEFHATDFSLEYMFICLTVQIYNICSYEHIFKCSTYEYMSICSYV